MTLMIICSLYERRNNAHDLGEKQRGKVFTLYCKGNPEYTLADWHHIIHVLTERLAAANIKPGYRPLIKPETLEGLTASEVFKLDRADREIAGTNYFTFRGKQARDEKIISKSDFTIDVPNQPPIKPFEDNPSHKPK